MARLFRMALFGVLATAQAFGALTLHVSPQGNDAWSGEHAAPREDKSDGPLATPARALARLREVADSGDTLAGAVVYLHEGDYYLEETLQFEAIHGGTEDLPLLFRAAPEATVRLIGGRAISGFETHEGGIAVADLSGQGLDRRITELYWNNRRQIPARWPNKGDGEIRGGGWTFITGRVGDGSKQSFHYAGKRPESWAGIEGVEVSIWPNYNWWQTIEDLSSYDAEAGTITLAKELPYTIEPGRRFFFQHVREELDAPGEWFHDVANEKLYFWPPESSDALEVVIPTVQNIIEVKGAEHVVLWGLHFAAAKGEAVRIMDSRFCLLAKSVIENVYGYGVRVQGGKEVRIMGNDIRETGRGGIHLEGGDRKTLTFAGHVAENNHIHHYGRVFQTYQTAVNVQGVGNRVRHNHIHDAPHIGILLGGNEHVIEYNDIHHVCMEGADNGAIYMGRDWTQRGIKIRYNKIHDVYGFGLAQLGPDEEGLYHYESPHQAWGVYLDDCSSGVEVHGNVFYRVPLCGVMIGGGRDNVVTNNIFFDSIPALHIDDRWDSYLWDVMQERLEAMNYREPPYSEKYPELLEMGDDPRRPENNRFTGNVIAYTRDNFRGLSTTAPNPNSAIIYDFDQFDPESTVIDRNLIDSGGYPVRIAWSVYQEDDSFEILSWETWRAKGYDTASILDSARFMDPEKDNYDLHRSGAAVRDLSFPRLPISRIGLYKDELRASWPPHKDDRKEGMDHQSTAVDIRTIE